MKIFLLIVLITILQICTNACKSNTNPIQSEKGYISVRVFDTIIGPVEDVDVYILPDSLIGITNKDGLAFFSIDAGNYFVDAHVCCIGPGFINYHEPVKVAKNDTVKVKLMACLLCQ